MSNGSSSYESLLKYYQHSIIEFQKYVKENYKDYINKYFYILNNAKLKIKIN